MTEERFYLRFCSFTTRSIRRGSGADDGGRIARPRIDCAHHASGVLLVPGQMLSALELCERMQRFLPIATFLLGISAFSEGRFSQPLAARMGSFVKTKVPGAADSRDGDGSATAHSAG